MRIFKLIEIDLEDERKRIANIGLNKRQKAALLKLVDLFERGEWQACLDHVNNKKAFPYNLREEYDEKEHISLEMGDILREVAFSNIYTADELLRQAQARTRLST